MYKIQFMKRINTGKNFSRRLRINNKIPAIIYGKKIQTLPIIINNDDLIHINLQNFYKKKILLTLINKKNILFKVKIIEIQYHPFKMNKLYHIDFFII
ncbi:50S ribosomal protein L25 [Enterobacteriaceae endosymbiont of Donacia cincticornis]|uniref:50S ribosomal protein L25 n=1 Tax=Enterobacteriaceae endosymbiont of Donacia cincticornis TaxID=2675773 RepID=UPI0014491F1F|nr:50S ribosomal protein L25 [Enterobacteriaceae endosymbiont of Donacia cincticornis]QJC35961.1 50S ribosomal protein L25 [Enterobacteriaceae endosymbiont of Donacia cincticornis]